MCDPASMVMASGTMGAAGSLFGGVSSMQAGFANSDLLNRQAALRQEKARVDIEAADIRFRRASGERNAGIGTTGISADSFSDVIDDDLKTSSLEKRLIQYGADVDSANLRMQAKMAKSQGIQRFVGSIFSAGGQMAGAYGKAYSLEKGGVSVGGSWATSYDTE